MTRDEQAALYDEAAALCQQLYAVVPHPNEWEGSEYQQLIFGKGKAAGARDAAAALRAQAQALREAP